MKVLPMEPFQTDIDAMLWPRCPDPRESSFGHFSRGCRKERGTGYKSEAAEHLRAVVERITYQNAENGYSVIKCQVKGYGDLVTVVGSMPEVHVGSVLSMDGNWRVDQKYGRQFSMENFEETLPATVYGIVKYLGSGLIKGIGPKYAGLIVRQFGKDTLEVIEEDPDQLLKVQGIGKIRVERIKKSWEEQKEIKNIMLFLQSHDVSTSHATKKTYKKPGLCNYYCSHQYPIGERFIPEVKVQDPPQITLQMLATINSLEKEKDRLIEITADGEITEEELADFAKIEEGVEQISMAADSLSLWNNNMIASGKIDGEQPEISRKLGLENATKYPEEMIDNGSAAVAEKEAVEC